MIESDVPSCPKDGSKMVRVPIRWGIIPSPDKLKEEGYGGAIYPGCLVPKDPPDWGWRCPACGRATWKGTR
jgi:hypothetical protein